MSNSKINKRLPATKRRGADSDVPNKRNRALPKDPDERKLEEGLEESMAGSDPVSITQPVHNRHQDDK
jgi:hypothetical protein